MKMKTIKIVTIALITGAVLTAMKPVKKVNHPVDPVSCSRYAAEKVAEEGGNYMDYYNECMQGRGDQLP